MARAPHPGEAPKGAPPGSASLPSPGLEELFERVREEASRGVWSRGVELARSGAVCGERDDGDEVALRVRPDTAVVSPLVILYVDDAEWECDCGGDADPCEHVAAAAIALRRARREGDAPTSSITSMALSGRKRSVM